MNNQFIQPLLIQSMNLMFKSQAKFQSKQYLHTHIITQHLKHSLQTFSRNRELYKCLLSIYESKWIIPQKPQQIEQWPQVNYYANEADKKINVIQELQKLDQTQRDVCQIMVRIIIIGIKSLLKIEIKKPQLQKIISLCKELHEIFAFEFISISQILSPFIQTVIKQLKSFIFYEAMFNIFEKLELYKLTILMQNNLNQIRKEWQKNQEELKSKIPFTSKKKNRQTVFLPTPKRNQSLAERQQINETIQKSKEQKSVGKQNTRQKQNNKSNIRFPQSNRTIKHTFRKSMSRGQHQFTGPKTTNGNINSSANNNNGQNNRSFQNEYCMKDKWDRQVRERRLTKIEETTCDDEKAFVLRDFSPTAKNQ